MSGAEDEPLPVPVDLPVLDLAPATRRLLDIVAADPEHTPCRGNWLWTSRDPDDRRLAATFCVDHCRHIHLCAEAAEAEDPQHLTGVWAGVDYSTRSRKEHHARSHDGQAKPRRQEREPRRAEVG